MKVSKVSRKSLFLYLIVFFFMLFFEAQRLTPLLEREGGKYPFLYTVNSTLQKIGKQTGLYAFSDTIHDEFAQMAEKLGNRQNWVGDFALSLAPMPQEKTVYAQKEEKTAQNSEEETGNKAISEAGNQAPNEALNEPLNEALQASVTSSAQASLVQTTVSEHVAQELAVQEQIVREQAVQEQTAQEQVLLYNDLHYPFNPALVFASDPNAPDNKNPHASAVYQTVLPDYGKKKTVLLIGDSMMMEGLGPTLHHRLRKRDNLVVYREGKYSSGLSRPDFYDWNSNLTAFLEKYQPDLLIMSLGANDTQDIVVEKKRYFIDSEPWAEIYLQRSKDFIALADNDKRRILWISLPVMGKEPYFTRTKLISVLQEEASKDIAKARFVNIEHLLTENGKYTTYYKDKNNKSVRLRASDLIHVSTAGGEILTDYLLSHVDRELNALYNEEVPFAYPPVAGLANRVVFTSSLRQKEVEYFIWLPETKTVLQNADDNFDGKTDDQNMDIVKTISRQLADKRYPVLYLLHGAYGSGKDYVEAMGQNLQEIANEKNVMIVAPSCEPFGWYVDSPLVADNQLESFITKELVPHIDSLYPTNRKRAVAGLSMGGHGAMLLGFYHRDLFQSMASISGVMDIREHKDSWKIKDLLGELANDELANPQTDDKNAKQANKTAAKLDADIQKNWDNNAINAVIAKKWPANSPKHIQIVTGTEDLLVLEENRKAQDLLHKRGFKFQYSEKPGSHNWQFWKEHIPTMLRQQADYLHGI